MADEDRRPPALRLTDQHSPQQKLPGNGANGERRRITAVRQINLHDKRPRHRPELLELESPRQQLVRGVTVQRVQRCRRVYPTGAIAQHVRPHKRILNPFGSGLRRVGDGQPHRLVGAAKTGSPNS